MKNNLDYIRDISEIRSMMERSSKFLSLSGWTGILAGTCALIGAWIAYKVLYFNPATISDDAFLTSNSGLPHLMGLALIILILVTGGLLILMLISKGLFGLLAPFSLLFYGLIMLETLRLG
ncbi:MAG: hypothetical protein R6V72_22640 [Cyclobacterium sp.]|uniref:hypothetical protein n=1 Tax=unclassified Cyclobacterium TaxID=2615055 RepID=UPI001F09B95F|nr:hypothetical protein [Cyclobacterium sp. SYSU L10401]